MRATLLGSDQLDAATALLGQDVDSNLFLLDLLDARGLSAGAGERWLGVTRRGRGRVGASRTEPGALLALAYTSGSAAGNGLCVPFGDPEACKVIGRALLRTGGSGVLVGPRAASDALWEGLGSPPTRVWHDQRLYVCDTPPVGEGLDIRPARLCETEVLADMSARMIREDLGLDPLGGGQSIQVRRTRKRIEEGSTLVAEKDGEIVFTIDIGTRCRYGAQVGGTYVPPAWRGRGLATRGMRAVCRRLLREVPRVTLHVHEANTPAVRCYRASGFRASRPFRLAIR